jgi:hypothetical protein
MANTRRSSQPPVSANSNNSNQQPRPERANTDITNNSTNSQTQLNSEYTRPPLNSDPNLDHAAQEFRDYDNRGYEFASPYGDQIYGYPYPPHMLYPQHYPADPRYPFPAPIPPQPQVFYPYAQYPEQYAQEGYYQSGYPVYPAQTHPATSQIPQSGTKPLPVAQNQAQEQEQEVGTSTPRPSYAINSSSLPFYPSQSQQPVPVQSTPPPKTPAPAPDPGETLPRAPTPPPENVTATSPPQSPTHLSGTLPFVANPPLPPHVTIAYPVHNNPPPLPNPSPSPNNGYRITNGQLHPTPPLSPGQKERSPFFQYLLEKNFKSSVGTGPNLIRFYLRIVQLFSAVGAIILTSFSIKTLPTKQPPFGEPSPLYFIYVICALTIAIDLFQIIHFYYRKVHYHPKVVRIYYFAVDFIILLFWFCDLLTLMLRIICPIAAYNGWCEIYNSSLFFSFTSAICALIIFVWDLIGTWKQGSVQIPS